MKKFLLLALSLSAALASAAIPYTRIAEPAPNLTPLRKRLAPRTLMYPENQYKYGLFQNFLDGYIDRPLFYDRATRYTDKFAYLTAESFLRDAKIMQSYGFDGGGNLSYSGYLSALKFAKTAPQRIPGYKQFPQFAFGESGVFFVKPAEKIKWLKSALAEKEFTPLINGKVPISVYNAANIAPEAMRKFIAELRKECGDTFYLVCNLPIGHETVSEFNRTGKLSDATIEKYRQRINTILTDFGGIQLRPVHDDSTNTDYTFLPSTEIYDRYIEPLVLEALKKPEFQDRIVVGMAQHGYLNHMSGVNNGSYGTKRIRQYLNRYARMNCDMVFFFEWNEFNENTCWQPTFFNSTVLQRLVRYYACTMRGEAPVPNANDDLNVPPLALSTREVVRLGEVLYFELLNIPDTLQSAAYTAKLEVLDLKGNVLLALPAEKFDRARLDAVSYRVPSENFAAHQALTLRLTVSGADGKNIVTTGFQSIRIQPTFNNNYNSVRHSLRDILKPEKVEFSAVALGNNQYRLRGKVASLELLNSVELLNCGREIFAVDKSHEFDRTKYEIIVGEVNAIHSKRRPVELIVTGTDDWDFREWGFPNVTLFLPKRNGDRVTGIWPIWSTENRFIMKIAKADAAKAQITFNVDGESKTFAVADIMKYGQLAHAYPKCRLSWEHYHRLPDIAPRLNEKTAEFDTVITSEHAYPVFQLRAVTNDGKIYRSAPVTPRAIPAPTEKLNVFSSYTGEIATVDVASALIPKLNWKFSPAAGDMLLNDFDRSFRCDLGGGYTYQGAYHTKNMVPPGRNNPVFVKENGKDVLHFDGTTYLHFTRETFPRGSFTLRFTVKPEPDEKTIQYVLFRHYDRILGSVTLFTRFDRLCFAFGDRALKTNSVSTALTLPPNQWSEVSVSYDFKAVTLSVNGVKKSFPLPKARALYFKPAIFGGHTKNEFGLPRNTQMFKGKLSSISIDHNAPEGK